MFHASRITYHASQLRSPIFWSGIALILGLFYLAVSGRIFGFSGFPLDDAWIHQTYARNLARSGQLAFVPNIPSAGSTAPLWTFLLSLGYLLGIPFQFWTYGLGILLLGLTGWTIARLVDHLFPESRRVGLGAGLFCVFEWHLIWAAVSGMETILFIWLSLFLFERYLAGESTEASRQSFRRDVGLGVLGGLLILVRPEGIGLVGLIGLDIAWRWWRQKGVTYEVGLPSHAPYETLQQGSEKETPIQNPKSKIQNSFIGDGEPHPKQVNHLLKRWIAVGGGVGVLLVPYMIFHLQTTGLLFPNTLYAKQAEYGVVLRDYSLWWRLFGNIGPPVELALGVFRVVFIGAQILLLPGLVFAGWLTIKERRSALLPIWLWWISYLLLYGLKLPVTYQHGRYQIPAIAWIILLGVWGTTRLVSRQNKNARRHLLTRVVSRALVVSLVMLALAFTVVGAQAYGRDVRIIESEMVASAKWLNRQIEPDALIAAHDIGAIGYFTERPLIDLAGLITPDVIPFIRNEAELFNFIIAYEANYLVTFPSWYPEMTQDSRLIPRYNTQALWAPQAGGDNMVVYQISYPAQP